MKFSAITALCAAPLALAGTLQADLVGRGVVGIEVAQSQQITETKGNQKSSNNDNNKNNKENNNNNNNGVTLVQSLSQEVIVIWVNNGGGAATSTVTETVTVTASNGGAPAAVATHQVTVGGPGGLVFTPEQVTAAVGDMVIFTFMSANHTATQSAFANPCVKLASGMDSGFMPNPNNSVVPAPQMAMQVTVATPIWFYCRQAKHCGQGMTFSINPTADKTQAMFKQMAISQNGTGTASPITGGTASAAAPVAESTTVSTAGSAAATSPPAAAAGTGMVTGTGSTQSGGACSCACLCGTAAFPNAAVQGIGSFGGLSGRMPMSMLEI